MSGYDVCRRIRADPATALLPVVLCTSLDPQQERINGIAAGADDFLGKPINQPELFARVQSLLRIKRCTKRRSGRRRSSRNGARRSSGASPTQVAENERLSRLKRFFSPQLAELILDGRRRGSAEEPPARDRGGVLRPARLHCVRRDHRAGGAHAHAGFAITRRWGASSWRTTATLERFTGDGMMVFLGDPVPVENAAAARRAPGPRDARSGDRSSPRSG